MQDPFARARQMHSAHAVPTMGAPAAAAPPQAAQPSMMSAVKSPTNFGDLSKSMGLGHLNLDKNSTIARTQLMQHLQHKFGSDYMNNPDVQKLLASFNDHTADAQVTQKDSHEAKTLKHLLGHP